MPPRFVYDRDKDKLNRKHHGMSLVEGYHVLKGDPRFFMTDLDVDQVEERWITIAPHPVIPGLLVVVYHHRNMQDEDTIRLISVRKATRLERKAYEERQSQS